MKWASSLKQISDTAIRQAGTNNGWTLHITGAACAGNLAVGIGKLVIGILSLSLFTCASAFYTFGMVAAKCFALAGIVKGGDSREQYCYYRASGIVLICASILYIIYSIRLFVNPVNSAYSMNTALGIATFTFAELTLNIKGVIMERHNHTLLIHAIKMVNLASAFICLVLTQAAILSFADAQTVHHPAANGFMGILMGSAAALLGVIMIIRIARIEKRCS